MRPVEDSFEKALQYAYLLLKYKDRSSSELTRRILLKGYSEENALKVEAYLSEKGFIDDDRLAGRLKIAARDEKLLGRVGVIRHLMLRGIEPEKAKEISGCDDEYLESAKKLVERRMRQLEGLDEMVIKQRLWGLLARRGFSPGIIKKALASRLNAEDIDAD